MFSLTKPVSIAAFTYNMGNSIGYGAGVRQIFVEELSPKEDKKSPAILIGCLQEAKHAVKKDQHLVERIASSLGYQELISREIDVLTKWPLPWNWPVVGTGKAHTVLAIYYDKDQINVDEIQFLASGTCIDDSKPDNKGGIWCLIRVRGVVIGVIGVHLDSYLEKSRDIQMQSLIDACYKYKDSSGGAVVPDTILTLGDFNLRLHKDVVNHDASNPLRKRTLTSLRATPDGVIREHKKLIEDSLKRWQLCSPSIRQFDFLRVHDYTYGFLPTLFMPQTEPSYVPNPDRDYTCDVGALDKIGVSQTGVAMLFPGEYDDADDPVANVLFPTSYGLHTSDHAAVVGFWTLYPAFKREFVAAIEVAAEAAAVNEEVANPMHGAAPAMDFALVNKYLAFVIRHLDVHNDKLLTKNDCDHYVNLIFGTCEKLESLTGNSGDYMKALYQQLFEADAPEALKCAILLTVWAWLITNEKTEGLNPPFERFQQNIPSHLSKFNRPMTGAQLEACVASIWGPCHAIANSNMPLEEKKRFMLDRYHQLLDLDCRAAIKVNLLWRFRRWLDQNNVARRGYQYAKSANEEWHFQVKVDAAPEDAQHKPNGSYQYSGDQTFFGFTARTEVFAYPATRVR